MSTVGFELEQVRQYIRAMIGSGVLDKEQEGGLLSHLNDDEFLSGYGLHSMSKQDPA